MKNIFRAIIWRCEFLFVFIPYLMIRLMPWPLMRFTAWQIGFLIYLLPAPRRLVSANIKAAMPELPAEKVRSITRKSFDYLLWNLTEYIWMVGIPRRIRRCCEVPESVAAPLRRDWEDQCRIIYVNPHLGSWEASGLMSPFYIGVKIAAIAKPMRNPYLNELLNSGNRENTPGLKIIFSKGAIRAALQALNSGLGIGTLIDQNTRVRDGGVFVNFFGLPVPSSTAPVVLKNYCDQKGMKSRIVFGCSLRDQQGRIIAHSEYLSKPFEEYQSAKEVLQELMDITERYIRQYPEQYLWMYKRFQHIPEDVSPEQRKRYPWYSSVPGKNFYRKVRNKPSPETECDGKTQA